MSSRRLALAGAQFMGAGFVFLTELGALTALGWWLDGKCGTGPWLMVVGSALGLTVAMSHLIRSAASFDVAMKKERAKKADAGDIDERQGD
ncbi:MAG: F0F1-type ATP synthase assembly protein I [Planctomycetota bacterium]|jgi:F0F1-type ATP synthase assembly protein I